MRTIAFTGFFFLWMFPLFAQNWTGAVSSDWGDAANWSFPPLNGCEITIDQANYTGVMAHPALVGESGFSPAEIHILNGGRLYVSGEMIVSDTIEVSGPGSRIILNSGEFPAWTSNAKMLFSDGANLLALSGTEMRLNRLEIRTGASANINGAQVSIGQLVLADGNTIGSSRLVQNGGWIIVNAVLFENESGDFKPTFLQRAGELLVQGELQCHAQFPGSGTGVLRSTGENSSVFVDENLGSDPAGTMRMHFSLDSSAQMLFAGDEVRLATGDSLLLGENTVWKDGTTTWINDGVFHATPSSEFEAGTTTLTGTGHYQFGGLSVSGIPKHLYHVSPQKIYISGDFNSSYDHFYPGTNRVVLNGSTAHQSHKFYNGIDFYDLEIDNTFNDTIPATTINGNVWIAHELALVDGVVRHAPFPVTSAIRLADDAVLNGGSDTCFIDGYIEKTGNEAFLFPVGKVPDTYRPLSIEAPASASTVVRVGYQREAYDTLVPVENPLFAVTMFEYWDLSRTGSNDQLIPAIGWNHAAPSGLTDCGTIGLAVWDGALWNVVPATVAGLCDADNSGSLTATGALPAAGPLTIGFTTPVYQQVVALCNDTSYTIGQHTYTADGVYVDTLQGSNGTDSVVVTDLSFPAGYPLAINTSVTTLYVTYSIYVESVQWLDCNNGFAPIPGATGTFFQPSQNGSYAAIIAHVGCTDPDTSECNVISQLALDEAGQLVPLIFPNPVKAGQELWLQGVPADESFTILAMDGRVIRTVVTVASGQNTVIPVEELVPGTYWLAGASVTGGRRYRFTLID